MHERKLVRTVAILLILMEMRLILMSTINLKRKSEIEEQVTGLLKEYGYSFEKNDYVNIVNFVKNLGFVVGNAELADNEDGFLMIRPQNKNTEEDKIIGVNVDRTFEWKRFIIAHELGHSILHCLAGKPYFHRENIKGKDESENEADYFAAALLMPKDSFKRLYNQLKNEGLNDTAVSMKLASVFKVPSESVCRRMGEVCEKA